MIYWITGRAGAGKTTFANNLKKELIGPTVILDGDDVRKYFPAGFDVGSRYAHIMRIATFAALLEDQGFTVIIALVSPKKVWRQEARKLFKESKLFYLPGGTLWRGTEYEEPDEEELE